MAATTTSVLRSRLDGVMARDAARLRGRLRGVERIEDRERRASVLAKIAADLDDAESRVATRRAAVPARLAYPADLPITEHRAELLDTIADNQVVVVAGETGSGKSTQLPKLCLELGRGVTGTIGHTQPRRIAARSIAERVAEEIGSSIGGAVGYTVRFSDQVGDATLVKVMTEGILLNEIHSDRRLLAYDAIILDEAHERSLNMDFLLGYLKALLPKRRDLKLIVTSATIDTERFAEHFGDAPVVEVSGRTYPVEVRYRPLDDPDQPEPRDQPQAIVDAVVELSGEGRGDVLVFCSGEREIRDAADALAEARLPHTEVLPLYGRLSAAEQHRVFQPHTGRRVVVATNVAETSLTVPGVRYVVDAGTARISRYGRRTKVQRLPIEPISRASADQRAGRCGRLGPGIAVRLYAEDDYESRPAFTEPEILRTNLASVILQMAALELGEIATFPFLDPPDRRAVADGIALLFELGALDTSEPGAKLTGIGRQIARFPLDPRLGRMLIEADRNGCLAEVLVIAAALSIQDPRERPAGKEAQADQAHARFRHESSDLLGWLELWRYVNDRRRAGTSGQFRRMCRDEHLSYRRLREWQDVHAQLRDVTDELGYRRTRRKADEDVIHRTLLAGLLSQVGTKDPDGHEYRGARGARFHLSPGSVLFKRSPAWVMAAELVETTRVWAHGVAPITVPWIEEAGAHLLQRSYSDPWWDAGLGSAVAAETVTIYGLPLVTDRTVQYGRIDPDAARELFIRHALVAGEWETHHRFVAHNAEQIAEVRAIETRERRQDLLVDEDALYEIFAARIPGAITSVRDFDRWWRDARSANPHLLDLTIDELIDDASPPPDPEAFPPVWHHGDLDMKLEYEHDPSSPTDGLTVDVPLHGLDRLDPAVFEWNVPGLRRELVTAMIRSLPKPIRRTLVPVADTVDSVLGGLQPGAGTLRESLRQALMQHSGSDIPPDAFAVDELPAHLRPTFRIVGDDGTVVAAGGDLAALKEQLVEDVRARLAGTSHPLEQRGVTAWTFGELPPRIEVEGKGARATGYPALVDEGDSVAIRVLATEAEQAAAMPGGTKRLLLLGLHQPEALLRPLLTKEAKLLIKVGPHGTTSDWIDDCLMAAVGAVVHAAGGPVWDAVAFDALLDRAAAELADETERVARGTLDLLATLHAVHQLLAGLGGRYPAATADVEAQLDRLVYPGFLSGVGAARLPDVHRYLRAVERRLERLPEAPARDAELMARIRRLDEEHDRLLELLPPSPELLDLAWQLEELRVSLFAQALGTAGKVSEQRIERALAALSRG